MVPFATHLQWLTTGRGTINYRDEMPDKQAHAFHRQKDLLECQDKPWTGDTPSYMERLSSNPAYTQCAEV